jgi:ubiquinone/menaquinone biosynthesis C-methylase UbiE
MKKDFDHIAKNYDTDFTLSDIGIRQRNSVYRFLEKIPNSLHILELNCGTGEDAIWFSKKGHKVLATDISSEMISVAKQKTKKTKNLDFQQLDINNLNDIPTERSTSDEESQFNLIFSNFGGLNCLNPQELQDVFKNASKIIKPNGKLALVIMPKKCLWERVYFMLKGQFKKAFRRNTDTSLKVNIDGQQVETWYYNPSDIKKMSQDFFTVRTKKPIGFFIPPSYLEHYFSKHKRFLSILDFLEKRIGSFGFLSRYADHYIIELQIKD